MAKKGLISVTRNERESENPKADVAPDGPIKPARLAIRDAEDQIVHKLIEKAKEEANPQIAKMLFEHARLGERDSDPDRVASLAEVLLRRLGLDEEIKEIPDPA